MGKTDYGHIRLVFYRPSICRPVGERLHEALKLHDRFGLDSHDTLNHEPEHDRLKEIFRRCHDGGKGRNVISIHELLESLKKARAAHMNGDGQIVSSLRRDRPDNAFDSYEPWAPN